ncbi:MAG: beta-Ala-His dipeptidase [Clostridiales bacterium]|nr:beta-Ala-His dipeptidase [Clostridiales bacterium]
MSLQIMGPASRVFDYFEEICSIPHGSGNMKEISDYCVAFAKKHHLRYSQDEHFNVIIWKDASAGREEEPAVILQGHLDMVAVAEEGSSFNFLTDSLQLKKEGDLLSANGTTLGGDDGIAVAMCLALLDDDTLSHPSLECVFTVDEEVGMLGAQELDISLLRGKYMLNLDCEDEGKVTVSCAGGIRAQISIPMVSEVRRGFLCRIHAAGLEGGHSGVEIHKGRVNGNRLMMEILLRCGKAVSAGIAELGGGAADNAIPAQAESIILVGEENKEKAEECLTLLADELTSKICPKEPNFALTWEWEEEPAEVSCWTQEAYEKLDNMWKVPDGVQAMSRELPGLVETSLNLGIMESSKDQWKLTYSIRSSIQEKKEEVEEVLKKAAETLRGTCDFMGDYPGWPVRAESPLLNLAKDLFLEMYGKELEVEAIHAGLECGIFASQIPELDIIAMGPDMYDIHSPREKLSISSTERMYLYVREMLCRMNLPGGDAGRR